jgi:hypothetical protein
MIPGASEQEGKSTGQKENGGGKQRRPVFSNILGLPKLSSFIPPIPRKRTYGEQISKMKKEEL